MRGFIRIGDVVLPIVGVLLIVATLLPSMTPQAIGTIIIGTLLIQAGLSKMSHKFLPEERRFLALRAEGELFLTLMRSLNAVAVQLGQDQSGEARREFEEVRASMYKSVERMTEFAGKTLQQISGKAGEPDSLAMWKNDFFGSPD
jgi:hypothetical protein